MFFKLFKYSFIVQHNLGLIKRKYFKKAFGNMTIKIYMQIIYITLLQCKRFSTDNLSLRDKTTLPLEESGITTSQRYQWIQTKTPIVFLTDLTVDACRISLTVQRSKACNQRMKGREPFICQRKRNHLSGQLSQKIKFHPGMWQRWNYLGYK